MAAAQFYFRFWIWWRRSRQNVRVYQQTKFYSYNWIHGWDISITSLEKQTSAIFEFYFRFRFRPYHCSRHLILQQFAKFHPNRTTQGRKMTSCRFSRWRISAVLNFRGPIIGSLERPCRTFYKPSIETNALNCLFFRENHVLYTLFGDRQTNGRTDKQMDSPGALNHLCFCEQRLNNSVRTYYSQTKCEYLTQPFCRTQLFVNEFSVYCFNWFLQSVVSAKTVAEFKHKLWNVDLSSFLRYSNIDSK